MGSKSRTTDARMVRTIWLKGWIGKNDDANAYWPEVNVPVREPMWLSYICKSLYARPAAGSNARLAEVKQIKREQMRVPHQRSRA